MTYTYTRIIHLYYVRYIYHIRIAIAYIGILLKDALNAKYDHWSILNL